MNVQPALQSRSSSNGHGHLKSERDSVTSPENKFQAGKKISTNSNFGKGTKIESSRDRLIYLTTSLIGQEVEVHVIDGSMFSGVFHATNTDDFEIVLKMARLTKDGSRGQPSITDSPNTPPSKTLIIPAKDLVQVIAKDVYLTREVLNEVQHEKQQEIMTDSFISKSRHVDLGRELERWVPDESDPVSTELENIFDGPWKRGWDQFEVNEMLFGVKSTFDEEIYTTKLERGPQMRELEREAMRLAREIEGEDTLDLHQAEERGIVLDGHLDIDEEARFSSVLRVTDDDGYGEIEDMLLDSRNDETFGGGSESVTSELLINGGVVQSSSTRDMYHSGSVDRAQQLAAEAEQSRKQSFAVDANRHDNQFIGHADSSCGKEDKEKQNVSDSKELSKAEDSHSLPSLKKKNSDKVSLSAEATAFDPSPASSKTQDKKSSSTEAPENLVPPKTSGPTQLTGSAPSSTDRGGATSTSAGRGLSPSSSIASLTSEKSSLNPHAKEFKFNPNAKSFVPTKSLHRPSSPVADGNFYYPTYTTDVTHMHGMPVGIGMGPFAPQQPVMFNPQGAPIPQPYYHPNGTQYGQQIMGQPHPVLYMPTYPPEMPYKGREF